MILVDDGPHSDGASSLFYGPVAQMEESRWSGSGAVLSAIKRRNPEMHKAAFLATNPVDT